MKANLQSAEDNNKLEKETEVENNNFKTEILCTEFEKAYSEVRIGKAVDNIPGKVFPDSSLGPYAFIAS